MWVSTVQNLVSPTQRLREPVQAQICNRQSLLRSLRLRLAAYQYLRNTPFMDHPVVLSVGAEPRKRRNLDIHFKKSQQQLILYLFILVLGRHGFWCYPPIMADLEPERRNLIK